MAIGRAALSGLRRRQLTLAPSVYVGALVAILFLMVQQGQVTVSDGSEVLAVAQSIVHHGTLTVTQQLGVLGRRGHYYGKYGLGMSVLAVPFIAVGDLIALVVGHKDKVEGFMAASAVPLIMGALAASVWRTASRLGARSFWAAIIAFGTVFGTYALPYGKDFFSEPLTTLGIMLCIESLLADRSTLAGVWISVAVVTRPETIVLLPLFALIVLWDRSLQVAVRFALVGAIGVAVDLLYNLYRFGDPLSTGYHGGFTTPFLHGAVGLLFTSHKSVFLFAPVILACIPGAIRCWPQHRMAVLLAGSNFVAIFVISATWWGWSGNWAWGPRLILPGVLPLLILLASLPRGEQRIAGGLFVVGFLVSASTIIVPTQAQQLDHPAPQAGPSIIRQYQLAPEVISYTAEHPSASRGAGSHRRYLYLWQTNFYREFGKKGLAGAGVGTLILLGMLWAVIRCRPTFEATTSGPLSLDRALSTS